MTAKQSREELFQYKVISCIKDGRRRSLEEVTKVYNRVYPVGIIKQVIGIQMSEGAINRILAQLVKKGLVSTEYLSFTDRPLLKPTMHFAITTEGLRSLSKKHS